MSFVNDSERHPSLQIESIWFAGANDEAEGERLSFSLPADELPSSMLHLSGEALDGRKAIPSSHQIEVLETPTTPSASAVAMPQQTFEPAALLTVPRPAENVMQLRKELPAVKVAQPMPQLSEKQEGQIQPQIQHEGKGQQMSEDAVHARHQEAKSLAANSAEDGAAEAGGEVYGSITMHQQRLGSINFTARTAVGGRIIPQPAVEMSDRPLPATVPSTSPLKMLRVASTRQSSKPSDNSARVSRTLHTEEPANKQAEGVRLPIVPLQSSRTDGLGTVMPAPGREIVLAPHGQLPTEETVRDAPPLGPVPSLPSGVLADRVEDSEAEDEAAMIEASQPAIFTQ